MKRLLTLLILSLISCSKSKETISTKIVGFIVYEDFSKPVAHELANALTDFYGIKTRIILENKLPEKAFINIKSPRYRADSLIKIQNKNSEDSSDYILGLTIKDISITRHDKDGTIKNPKWKYNDFGVMGLGYCPGKSCVISSFRLKNKNKTIELSRLKKVVIHEFGHNLGLKHCINKKCIMTSAAEKIATIDNEKMALCEKCKKKLNLKFPQ